jgi:type I restriction enzyme S subunit
LFDILDNRRKPLNSTQRAELTGTVPYYGANGCVGFVDTHIFDEPLILLAEDGGNFDQYRTRPIAYRIDGKSWVNNHAHVLRAKSEFSQDYLYYAFVHKNIIPFLNGGTRAKLNKSALEEIELPVPTDKAVQDKIADYFNSIEGLIEKASKQKALLEKQKQGLMQKLLTGKVRVKA